MHLSARVLSPSMNCCHQCNENTTTRSGYSRVEMSSFVQALRNSILYTGYRKPMLVVSALTFSLFWLTVLSVGIGEVTVSPAQEITILAEQVGLPGWVRYEPVQKDILLDIRLPRVVLAVLTRP